MSGFTNLCRDRQLVSGLTCVNLPGAEHEPIALSVGRLHIHLALGAKLGSAKNAGFYKLLQGFAISVGFDLR